MSTAASIHLSAGLSGPATISKSSRWVYGSSSTASSFQSRAVWVVVTLEYHRYISQYLYFKRISIYSHISDHSRSDWNRLKPTAATWCARSAVHNVHNVATHSRKTAAVRKVRLYGEERETECCLVLLAVEENNARCDL